MREHFKLSPCYVTTLENRDNDHWGIMLRTLAHVRRLEAYRWRNFSECRNKFWSAISSVSDYVFDRSRPASHCSRPINMVQSNANGTCM